MQGADRVDVRGRPHGQRRHVELRAVADVVRTEGEEPLAVLAELAPAARQVLFDEVELERIVTGWHRRVCREDGGAADRVERGIERRASLQVLADPLQRDERGVALVEMPHRRRDAQRPQGADAADAEDDLLLDARLPVPAVEARRQFTVPRGVLGEVRVEQVQADAAEPDAPHRRQHRPVTERHRRDARPPLRRQRRGDRRLGPRQPLVVLLLPAVVRHALVEVALRIHEADADERHAEVTRLLAVVAGEHAEAAGVDRQRLVQGELRRGRR